MTPAKGKFALRVTDDVALLLKKLHPSIKSHIRNGLRAIVEDPYSGKALKDELRDLRSYRMKRYRIIYRVCSQKQHIEIVAIGPRKIIYEETFRILSIKQNSK